MAPDWFASSDVCLGGIVMTCSSWVTRVLPAFLEKHMRGACAQGVGLKLLRKADVL